MHPSTVLVNGVKLLLKSLLIFSTVFFTNQTYSQEKIEYNLIRAIETAPSDTAKTKIMGKLSRYYYANKSFEKADSVFEKSIMLSESTLKAPIVLQTYFENTAFLISSAETKERTKSTRTYVNRAIDFAKTNDVVEYVALGYAHLAAIDLSEGQQDEAFRNANFAYTTSLNRDNDSIQVLCAIQLGKVYQEKSDILMAYKVFTNAHNIAINSGNEGLLPPVFHAIAELYRKFGKPYEAKKYVHQSYAINKRLNNVQGQVNDLIFLAKLSNYIAGKSYLQDAIRLSDQINSLPLKLEAEKILFAHYIVEESPQVALAFLEEKAELKNVYAKTGPSYLDWMIAEVYLWGGKNPDSAFKYFKIAEPAFNSGYDLVTKKNFFEELAYCVQLRNDISSALNYYQRTFELSKASSDLKRLQNTSAQLRDLYEKQGNYQRAFVYGKLFNAYQDSVDILGRERDLALLEIDNVNKQKERDDLLAKQKLQRKFNLQYMVITIVIALIFLALIMIGMFKVSTTMIRIMGFLSLIFFFEFIILLLDTWIHHLTHGEPWKIWVIKIGIISIILPLHHFLEHKLIHYLLSRHLITVRSKLSFSSLFKKKKLALKVKEDLEKDPIPKPDQSQDAGGGQIVPKLK